MNESIKSVYDALKYHADSCGNAPALLYMGKSFSYKKLLKSVDKLADTLLAHGIVAGDIITLCLPNLPQTVYCFYAASKIGASCHFLHALSGAEQIKASMKHTNSKLLFIFSAFAENLVLHFKDFDVQIVSCSPASELGTIKKSLYSWLNRMPVKVLDYTDFCRNSTPQSASKIPPLTGLETVALLNSGGTTGEEKTIELSSYALNTLCANGKLILNEVSLRNKYMMAALPLFHGFCLAMGLHVMICNGGCSVILPKFNRKSVIKYLKKRQINFMIGVPALYNALLAHPKFNGNTIKSIKVAYVGGDFVPQTLMDSFNKRMSDNGLNSKLYEGYGLTETVTVACVNMDTDNREKTVGRPLKDIQIAAFFTTSVEAFHSNSSYVENERLPSGTIGELCISGPTLMNGYYKDEKTTSQVFFTDANGVKWVRTGDCGLIDSDGYVIFKQRLKRIIKVSGENVFPSQIEQIVSKIDGVKQVCAFPYPDIKKGSVVHLAIESDTHNPQALATLALDTLKNTVYPPAVPQKIHILKIFPQTKFSKIDLAALEIQIQSNSAYTKDNS